MRFEVLNCEGRIVFWTEHYSCIPKTDQLTSMNASGYKFKLDGRTMPASKLIEATKTEPRSDVPRKNKKLF